MYCVIQALDIGGAGKTAGKGGEIVRVGFKGQAPAIADAIFLRHFDEGSGRTPIVCADIDQRRAFFYPEQIIVEIAGGFREEVRAGELSPFCERFAVISDEKAEKIEVLGVDQACQFRCQYFP